MSANRIWHHIKIIIHQVAFLLGMQVWFNIRKPIIITHHINRCEEKNHMYDWLYRCYKKIRYKCTITSWLNTLPRIGIDGCSLSVTKTISVWELEPRVVGTCWLVHPLRSFHWLCPPETPCSQTSPRRIPPPCLHLCSDGTSSEGLPWKFSGSISLSQNIHSFLYSLSSLLRSISKRAGFGLLRQQHIASTCISAWLVKWALSEEGGGWREKKSFWNTKPKA